MAENKPVHTRLGRRRSVDDQDSPSARLGSLRFDQHNLKLDDTWTLNKLHLSDQIYGREREVSTLRQTFSRIRRQNEEGHATNYSVGSELVLVVSHSGTGKSVLVQELRKPVEASGGNFASGKFDPQNRTEPYTAFVFAFTELCNHILLDRDQSLRNDIKNAVGADRDILTSIIPSPSLKAILGEGEDADTSTAAGGKELLYRLQFAFRRFVRAACSPSHPLVLFLDDLQWADASSLELIENLVNDIENSSLLIVAAYRDDEVDDNHPLSVRIRDIESAADVAVTRLVVGNLKVEAVSSIVCQALRMEEELTRTLTEIIHRKTRGNAYFVVQFLRSLEERGLLEFNFGLMRWRWDEGKIESAFVTANVASFMASKIRGFSVEVQFVLQVAACLGCDFNMKMLQLAMASIPMSGSNSQDRTAVSESDLCNILEEVVAAGLLEKKESEKRFVFVHNQIQAAAFHLIPEEEQNQLQVRIGIALVYNATPGEMEHFLFAAVDLCNCGAPLIPFCVDGDAKKVKLAELNLRAGQKAMASAAYASAESYLSKGMALLNVDGWEKHAHLYLSLCHEAIQAHYCIGNIDAMSVIVDDLLRQDIQCNDKFPAYWYRILSDCSTGNHKRGIDTTYRVLQQMGVKAFPHAKASATALFIDLMKTKRALKNHEDQGLSNLPAMVDENEIKAMSLLDLLATMTYQARPDLFPFVVFRMVRHTVKHGSSTNACTAFAAYGILLCGVFNDFEGGCRFGKIALSLVKGSEGRDKSSRVVFMVNGMISHWMMPAHACVQPLQRGYEVGMDTGNIDSAMFCLSFYGRYLWYTSQHLGSLEADLKSFCDHMKEYKQLANRNILLPFLQAVQNLQGRTDNPLVLTGEVMDQREMLQLAKGSNNLALVAVVCSLQVELAYLFNKYESARILLGAFGELESAFPSQFQVCRHSFFECLTLIALARQSKRRKSIVCHAVKLKKKIKKWVQAGNANVLHMYQLVQAEMAALRGERGAAKEKYKLSALTATKNGFLQDASLARERAGIFFISEKDSYWATYYLERAHQGYNDWGCKAKADQIAQTYASLLSDYLSKCSPVSGVANSKRWHDPIKSYSGLSRRRLHAATESLKLRASGVKPPAA